MSLQDLKFLPEYRTGENNLLHEFYLPCFRNSSCYDRAVGFFNSSIYRAIGPGLSSFIKNNGRIRLICGVKLSEDDVKNIQRGYEEREVIEGNLTRLSKEFLINPMLTEIANLCWLIKHGILDIKVSLPDMKSHSGPINKEGIYHEKIGVFYDNNGSIVAFSGSINESSSGWMTNYESFDVYCNWINESDTKRAYSKSQYFEKLWNNQVKGAKVFSFPDALKLSFIEAAPKEFIDDIENDLVKEQKFIPRECQQKAYEKFVTSNSICLFQMATGSGKTKAALYSIQQTLNWKILLILVPLGDLVKQWYKDVKKFFPNDFIIQCGTDYPGWKQLLLDIIQAKIPIRTIVISTYQSALSQYAMEKWKSIEPSSMALVCDEVHNIGSQERLTFLELVKPNIRIGLSATPVRNFDELGTGQILDYFNNNTYTFYLRDAINEKYLVEYEYYIHPSFLSDDEWDLYIEISNKLSALIAKSGKKDNNQKLFKTKNIQNMLFQRSKIIKTAINKGNIFLEVVNSISTKNRTLIYADSLEHLEIFASILDKKNKEYFIYTGNVDAKFIRPQMLKEFDLGIRKYLLAVKCLDEGIDIPNCDCAIFISSSTSEREFIQRRGRVLRKAPNKYRAYIHDFFVIPKYDRNNDIEKQIARTLVEKEYQRFNLICQDAINGTQQKLIMDHFLSQAGLNPFEF